MLRLLHVLATIVLLASAAPASAAEIVVDNADQAVQRSGDWVATSVTPGYYGNDYLYHVAGDGSATITWPFPTSSPAGRYEVFARWNSGPNRAEDATYTIVGNAGPTRVTVNQKQDGGAWRSLGTFDFAPAPNAGVSLSDKANGVVIADAVRWVGPLDGSSGTAPAAEPSTSAAAIPAPPTPAASWTVALKAADLHAGPDAATDSFGTVPQFSYLQLLGYQDSWAYVYNPRTRGSAYIQSDLLGPSDPPPAWVTADPPAPFETLDVVGRSVGNAPLAFYPVDDPFAYTSRLGHNTTIHVTGRVHASDGSTWYRVDKGFLSAASVRLPRTPQRTFSGRWIDADLTEPAMLTAYQGDRVVLTTLTIKGTVANQTPVGTFTIGRRVADETMDSETVGIPRNGPGGYHLEHVRFTQYFTSDGASIHYNYWSSNWGFAGSHGCLGVPYSESSFLWDWADIGTPVVIRSS